MFKSRRLFVIIGLFVLSCCSFPSFGEDNRSLPEDSHGKLKVGEPAPSMWAMLPDGSIATTENFRKKVVLLELWSIKDKRRNETQVRLSQLRKSFLGEKKVLILSVCIDGDWEEWLHYCDSQQSLQTANGGEVRFYGDALWWQSHLQMEAKEEAQFLSEYNVEETPTWYLFGYGGKFVHSGTKLDNLKESISEQLKLTASP